MLMVAVMLVALVTVPIAGGRLGALAEARLAAGPWLLGALALQVLVISVVPGELPGAVAALLHGASYGAVAVFLWANRSLAGLWAVALGAGLNASAIAANGGVMPASRQALEVAGLVSTSGEFENSAVVEHPRLAFLGDIFAVPSSWPLANVFSVGDVLIVVGAVAVVHHLCGSRLARGSSRSPEPVAG